MSQQSYTNRNQLCALALELWRLRDALIRTTRSEAHIADLLRSLRVLVLDDGDALLLTLADRYRVNHKVATAPTIRPPAPGKRDNETGGVVIEGMVGFAMPDVNSRWQALRDRAHPNLAARIEVDYRDYLHRAAGADATRATAISRKALLADLCNKSFAVHASKAYPKHVEMAWLTLETGVFYVTLAQELAYETLVYGEEILRTGMQRLGMAQSDLLASGGVLIPRLACDKCNAQLNFATFSCTMCGAELLEPLKKDTTGKGLSDTLRMALPSPIVTLVVLQGMAGLLDTELGDVMLGEASDSKGNSAALVRTRDLKLSWHVRRGDMACSADVSIRGYAGRWKAESKMVLFLCWNPDRAKIEIGGRPGLRATSDGLPWDAEEAR